ncbi:MAG: hypothetical protein KGI27_00590 [Thaumarchaeota archaeon]|nr:hypothetical protein [Nitrososphaerota archaeon]
MGSFWYSNPTEPSQFFKIPYRIDNGTITALETNNKADIFVDIKSDKEGKFDIQIPKNFPYTNYDFDSRNYLFDILINDNQVDTHAFESQNDCYYVFSLPFKENSQIKISFNADYQSKKPWYGDKVDPQCISKTVVNNLQDNSSLIPMNFTYPKLVQDYWKGMISLPVVHDQYTNFSTNFRTTFNGDTLPYTPTGTTKKQLIDENFQEYLKRMGAADLIRDHIADLNRTVFHLEQERERSKLLHYDNKVKDFSDTIGVLEQQVSVYQQESKRLWDELGLIQTYNIDLFKMDPQKTQEYSKAQAILTQNYLSGNNAKPNYITTVSVDSVNETLVIGVNVPSSVDKKQYVAELSDEIKKLIGGKISFEIRDLKICILEDASCMGPPPKTASPYQQFKHGTSIDSVKCDPPFELHIKGPTQPICIKPETYDKLVSRGYFLYR